MKPGTFLSPVADSVEKFSTGPAVSNNSRFSNRFSNKNCFGVSLVRLFVLFQLAVPSRLGDTCGPTNREPDILGVFAVGQRLITGAVS